MNPSHDLSWNQSSLLNSAESVGKPQGAVLTPEDIGTTFLLVLASFYSFSSLVGTPGNVLTIAAILLTESLHSIPDMLILSLSCSDLLVVAVYQPINAYRYSNLHEANNNTTLQQLRTFVGYTSLIASVTSLLGVTVERLIAIKFPLRYDLYVTFKKALYAITFIWILSLSTGCAYGIGKETNRNISRTYVLLVVVATVVMYVYILIVARRQEKAMVVPQGVNEANSVQNRKAARTIAIVLGVFVATWLPLLLLPIFVSKVSHPIKFQRLFMVFITLSTYNSTINPFIYCFRSERYRRAVVKLLSIALPSHS